MDTKSLLKRLMTLVSLGLMLFSQVAYAQGLSQTEENAINGDSVWYLDSGGSGSCTVDLDVSLSGNDNAQKAFNFFIGKGLTPIQAAAILGNFQRESGINPKRVQGDGESDSVPLDGTTGYGLAQWTDLARQQALNQYADDTNQAVSSLALQLNFAWQEASKGGVISNLKTTTTIEAATTYWMNSYERPDPSLAALDLRIQYAKDFLAQFGAASGSGGTAVTVPQTGSTCSSTGPGQNSQYVDGFTIYSQYDPAWANKPYATSTIAVSGCGPSAMAMIITALTGKSVTPDVTAAYAASKDLYVPGEGSSWSIGPVLASNWGLNSTFIGANMARINATLQSGGLVITSGEGPLPFTTGGHFIVIRGVTADGKWMVGDSAHPNANLQEWDPQQILTNMNDGSVYAITK